MTKPYLSMENINKAFPGVKAITDLNFGINLGEVVALLGANGAGKSTLMSILGGITHADSGEIFIENQPVKIQNPIDASRYGISFVHQEMTLLPTLTIMENMFITKLDTRAGLINKKPMIQKCQEILGQLGSNLSPNMKVQELTTGERQIVEIGRALLGNNRIIILDEPTSSLANREKDHLFSIVRTLKQKGVAIVYITHFMNEAFDITDRVVVLRGGTNAGEGKTSEMTYEGVVRLMVGDVKKVIHELDASRIGEPVMEIAGLSRRGVYKDINFTLHKGEVLGLWGLLGSGRTEIARGITGLDPIDKGLIWVKQNGGMIEVKPSSMKKYIGMITEDRRGDGLLLPMSVKNNMSLANLGKLLKMKFFVDTDQETKFTQSYIDRLQIKVSSLMQPVETLSGGNQQKVIVGRWLMKDSPIIIMDEPTRGLDVRAKQEISKIMNELSANGTAILLINSEIDEFISQCDRFLAINHGQVMGEFGRDVTKDQLIAASMGIKQIN